MHIFGTSSNFVKSDPVVPGQKRYHGHKYVRASDGRVCHEQLCKICLKKFTYEVTPELVPLYIKQGRWDFKKQEVLHCGNSSCSDFQMRRLKHVRNMKARRKDAFRAALGRKDVYSFYESALKEGLLR